MDLKFQSFSEALQAFRNLIQLDLDKIKLLLRDNVVIDGIQNEHINLNTQQNYPGKPLRNFSSLLLPKWWAKAYINA